MQTLTDRRVRFVDLVEQTTALRSDLDAAIARVVDRTDFILGDEVEQLEAEFAAYCGVQFAVGVDSGFSALELGLRGLGIGPGHEVITQANTFVATVGAIMAVGARPVLVDCGRDGAFDVERFAAAITPRTRALIPVHLLGRLVEMDDLARLALKHGVAVLEDACQAHGARLDGQRAGSFGAAAAFSFYPGKNLGAFGDAGMVVTQSEEIANRIRALRHYGQRVKYIHDEGPPMNRRLDTIQAAILRVKLRHLEAWNEARAQRADLYREMLAGVPVMVPPAVPKGSHVYHLFVIETEDRDGLAKALSRNAIETGIHYPIPAHLQPALRHLGYREGEFQHTERLARTSLSLPMYPELAVSSVVRVADSIRQFFDR